VWLWARLKPLLHVQHGGRHIYESCTACGRQRPRTMRLLAFFDTDCWLFTHRSIDAFLWSKSTSRVHGLNDRSACKGESICIKLHERSPWFHAGGHGIWKTRSRRRSTIQYADDDSEDRPRLFSSYFKEDQSREKEKSKEEETATLANVAARRKDSNARQVRSKKKTREL
jgi:hypothetical protein